MAVIIIVVNSIPCGDGGSDVGLDKYLRDVLGMTITRGFGKWYMLRMWDEE